MKTKTILIVEDEEIMLNSLVEKFTIEGFDILIAKDGERGLEVALDKKPDLILLDIILPKMDGMTMMRKLRKENNWGKDVPIILLTNLTSDDSITEGVARDNPTYYLVKTDWSLNEVVEKVKERLGLIN
ncbi:MAG: response regulator [Candidatus Pacebacteria bacterium]|nr:response regulator [Candidatus Paceibacterota bacterium]